MYRKNSRLVTFSIGGLLFVASASGVFAQGVLGKVSGLVVGDDGKPLAAVITANKPGPPVGAHAVSGQDGSFTLTGLQPGTYELCASPKADIYLDPCNWSAVLPTVHVAASQTVTGYRLILKKGASLTVKLNDPQHALSSGTATAGKAAPHVIVASLCRCFVHRYE